MCQSLVKPDCSKPKVIKSAGMLNAVCGALLQWPQKLTTEKMPEEVEKMQCIYVNKPTIPPFKSSRISLTTVEFAGVKFKTNAV